MTATTPTIDPDICREFLRGFSSLLLLLLSLPLLLVHGKKDLVVPFDQSHDMAEKLEKLGKPVQFIEQPDADHHFSRMEDRLEFLNAMEAFLKKYNPA
mgnify:CR=1 FL=1